MIRSLAASHDVIVVGDGPAGSALAHALHAKGADVLLVGRDDPWTATYGVWRDEISGAYAAADTPGGLDDLVLTAVSPIRVSALTERSMTRAYAIVDNAALRKILRHDVPHLVGDVSGTDLLGEQWLTDVSVDGERRSCRSALLVDATGWPRRLGSSSWSPATPIAWQTAWGVVLPEPPSGSMGTATVMDWTPPGGVDNPVPTFGYALPVEDGWLVEETVLASRHPVEPELLRPVLARRLGWTDAELTERALRVEKVCIPMGAPIPSLESVGLDDVPRSPVPFGAAAAFGHPATGYQVAPALSMAATVADALLDALDARPDDPEAHVLDAMWSPARRRTRALHEFGLDVMLRLDADGLRQFFETFFALPDEAWAAQLRIDTPPSRIGVVMMQMFGEAPWGLRRRLLSGDLRLAAGLFNPGSEGVLEWSRRRILPRPRHG